MQASTPTAVTGRTQASRSAHTRERLLDATIACLVELGYARTTTVEVIERTGLSRGAMLHHFPSRMDLLVAAVEHLAERRIAEFTQSVHATPDGPDRIASALDLLWDNFSSDSSYAMLELTVAARTDGELYGHLAPLVRRYEQVVAEKARELFGVYAPSARLFEAVRSFIYHVMHGLAVTQILRDDDAEARRLLRQLKKQAIAVVSATLAPDRRGKS